MAKKVIAVSIVTVIVLIMLALKIYPEINLMSFFKQDKETQLDNNTKELELDDEKNITNQSKEEYPFNNDSEKEYAKKHPDKFNIVKTMYFSWDHIKNVHAIYELHYPMNSGSAQDTELTQAEFYVDLEKKRNFAAYNKKVNENITETENILLKDNKAIRQKPEQNIFTKTTVKEEDMEHYLGLFNAVITNSEWQTLIYNNYEDWEYTEEKEFGVQVYKIKGTINEKTSESLKGPFTMTVAKDTGILLELSCYGAEDKVIQSILVKDIQINKGISDNIYKLDVSNNKELTNKEFNLSGIKDNKEKKGGVDTSND